MFRSFAAVVAAFGFMGLVAAGAPAQAATSLAGPGSLTVGAFQYSWNGFSGGFCTTQALCANAQVVANVTNTGIEIRPITGALVSTTSGADMSVYIQIDSLTGAPINSFGISTNGTLNASAGGNLYTPGGVQITAVPAAVAGTSSSVALATSPARTSIVFGMDTTKNSGQVNFVGITPTTVPEPATLAILATGVVGLIGLRRRKSA